jgi:hypothetical protein
MPRITTDRPIREITGGLAVSSSSSSLDSALRRCALIACADAFKRVTRLVIDYTAACSREGIGEPSVTGMLTDTKGAQAAAYAQLSRQPEAGSRKLEAGSWKREAGSRKREAGSRKQEALRKESLYGDFPP